MMHGILGDIVISIGAVLIVMLACDTWNLDETENGND